MGGKNKEIADLKEQKQTQEAKQRASEEDYAALAIDHQDQANEQTKLQTLVKNLANANESLVGQLEQMQLKNYQDRKVFEEAKAKLNVITEDQDVRGLETRLEALKKDNNRLKDLLRCANKINNDMKKKLKMTSQIMGPSASLKQQPMQQLRQHQASTSPALKLHQQIIHGF